MEEARKKSHYAVVVKLGEDSRKVEPVELVMKLAGGLACQLRGGKRAGIVERIDSGS